MKKYFLTIALLATAFIVTTQKAAAQFSLGVHGSYFVPDAKGADGKFGAGVQAKVFLGQQFAIGAGVKSIGEKSSGTGYEFTNSIVPVTGMAEYYFSTGAIRPYLGAEAGVFFSTLKSEILGVTTKNTTSNFGVAPKFGLAIPIGNLGIFAEGSYNFIFDKEDASGNGSPTNANFDSSSKFFMVNAGLTFGFGGK
jgi:outer membrane protein W